MVVFLCRRAGLIHNKHCRMPCRSYKLYLHMHQSIVVLHSRQNLLHSLWLLFIFLIFSHSFSLARRKNSFNYVICKNLTRHERIHKRTMMSKNEVAESVKKKIVDESETLKVTKGQWTSMHFKKFLLRFQFYMFCTFLVAITSEHNCICRKGNFIVYFAKYN